MKSPRTVKQLLKSLQGITIQKFFYRFVGIKYINNLLSCVGSLDGGRYNLKNTFEVLYMAPDPETAIAETIKPHNFKLPPKIIITIDVIFQNILNLEDQYVLEHLGLKTKQLFCSWRIPSDKETYTQTLGRIIHETKIFEGIRYPSVIVKNKYNLGIFPDRLRKGSRIKIYDPQKLVKQIISGKH